LINKTGFLLVGARHGLNREQPLSKLKANEQKDIQILQEFHCLGKKTFASFLILMLGAGWSNADETILITSHNI
jgi:hypothetical protein